MLWPGMNFGAKCVLCSLYISMKGTGGSVGLYSCAADSAQISIRQSAARVWVADWPMAFGWTVSDIMLDIEALPRLQGFGVQDIQVYRAAAFDAIERCSIDMLV